jgi:hypothetical protein
MRLNALFRLAFATASPHGLTLPHTITRRLILQKARGHFTQLKTEALPRLVGTRFQVLFHDPSPGYFSPFPHGTCSLSVTREYLGLGVVPPDSHGISRAPCYLGYHSGVAKVSSTGVSPSMPTISIRLRLPMRFLTPCQDGSPDGMVPQPRSRNACRLSHVIGLACSPFAHHYSGNRGCFLFLWVLRCFTSPRYLHLPYVFRQG